MKETFIIEIIKNILTYSSISYFGKKAENEIFQIISPENSLKFSIEKDTTKNSIDFQLTSISGKLPKIWDKKIYNFSLSQIGSKSKKQITEPIESVIIRGQQKFELNGILNPVEIEINNNRISNILKKYKNVYYKLTPLGILFPASIKNDTKQIFVTCRVK